MIVSLSNKQLQPLIEGQSWGLNIHSPRYSLPVNLTNLISKKMRTRICHAQHSDWLCPQVTWQYSPNAPPAYSCQSKFSHHLSSLMHYSSRMLKKLVDGTIGKCWRVAWGPLMLTPQNRAWIKPFGHDSWWCQFNSSSVYYSHDTPMERQVFVNKLDWLHSFAKINQKGLLRSMRFLLITLTCSWELDQQIYVLTVFKS